MNVVKVSELTDALEKLAKRVKRYVAPPKGETIDPMLDADIELDTMATAALDLVKRAKGQR